MSSEIGGLNKRITLQYITRASNDRGGFVDTYVDVAPVWAKAWTVSSAEGLAGMQMTMTRVQKFKIRYRSVIKPWWIVKWGTRYFNIKGIDPDEKNEFLYLTCEEAA